MDGFIDALGLRNITLVIHDWGSALGFHCASRHESNVKALAFMEAILAPVPSWDDFPPDFKDAFQAFRAPEVGWDMLVNQNMFVEQVLPGAVVRKLSDEEMDRYREPVQGPKQQEACLAAGPTSFRSRGSLQTLSRPLGPITSGCSSQTCRSCCSTVTQVGSSRLPWLSGPGRA